MGPGIEISPSQGALDLRRGPHLGVFAYEYHDDSNENCRFDSDRLMAARLASINKHSIFEAERHFRWPLGLRPDDHPGLSERGL